MTKPFPCCCSSCSRCTALYAQTWGRELCTLVASDITAHGGSAAQQTDNDNWAASLKLQFPTESFTGLTSFAPASGRTYDGKRTLGTSTGADERTCSRPVWLATGGSVFQAYSSHGVLSWCLHYGGDTTPCRPKFSWIFGLHFIFTSGGLGQANTVLWTSFTPDTTGIPNYAHETDLQYPIDNNDGIAVTSDCGNPSGTYTSSRPHYVGVGTSGSAGITWCRNPLLSGSIQIGTDPSGPISLACP